MDFLIQMQNRFAGELSLQKALGNFTEFVPGSFNRDGGPQFLVGYHLGQPGQILGTFFPLHRAKVCSSSLDEFHDINVSGSRWGGRPAQCDATSPSFQKC